MEALAGGHKGFWEGPCFIVVTHYTVPWSPCAEHSSLHTQSRVQRDLLIPRPRRSHGLPTGGTAVDDMFRSLYRSGLLLSLKIAPRFDSYRSFWTLNICTMDSALRQGIKPAFGATIAFWNPLSTRNCRRIRNPSSICERRD